MVDFTVNRFENDHEFLNIRARKMSSPCQITAFLCMGKIFCAELPSKFHIEYLTHTLRDVIFLQVWKFQELVFLDGPRSLTVLYDTSCFYGVCLILDRKDRFDSWTKDGTASIRDHHPHQLLDVGLFGVDTTDPPPYPQLARPDLRRSALKWRHNERHGVSNHQPHDCLFNCLFRRRSKKTSKLRVTGLCAAAPEIVVVSK